MSNLRDLKDSIYLLKLYFCPIKLSLLVEDSMCLIAKKVHCNEIKKVNINVVILWKGTAGFGCMLLYVKD